MTWTVSAPHLELGCKSALPHVGQRTQHLSCLVVVAVNGLLTQDDQIGLLLIDHALQELGHFKGLWASVYLNMNTAISAERQRGANLLLTAFVAHGDDHHLGYRSRLFQAHCFFNSDFTKGIDSHFDVV